MNRVGFFSWNRLVEARTTAKKRREREKEKRDSWKRTDNDMRSTRRALPSPWKKFSRRWPPTIHIIRGKSCTSHILSLSLSVQFQIGERITTELIITDVLSVNRGIASRGNFEGGTNLNIFEISNSNSDQCFETVVIGLRGLLTYRERRPSSIESKNKKRKRTFSMESFEREREREKSINLSTRFEILKMMIFNGTRNFSVFFLLLVRFLLRSTMILREFEDSLAGYEIGN